MRHFHVRIGDEYDVDVPSTIGRHYEIIKMIGSGSFSVVALVVHRPTNTQLACKICSRELLIKYNTFDRFEQEVRLLEVMRHPNLVRLVDIIFDDQLIYVVMEYCSNGELFQYICDHKRLEASLCHRIFKQLVSAMIYIHSKDIAHRDLKPENILLDADLNPKIADFGLCHVATEKQLLTTPCGSPFYAPPEIISNEAYDGKKGDVWSLGVVLFTMATGSLPWRDTNQMFLFQEIKNADYRIPNFVDPKLSDLIQQMMNPKPEERPSMEQLMEHPWVAEEFDDFVQDLEFAARQARSQATFNQRSMVMTPGGSAGETPTRIQRRQLIVRPNVVSAQTNVKSKIVQNPLQNLIRRVPTSGKHRPGMQNV